MSQKDPRRPESFLCTCQKDRGVCGRCPPRDGEGLLARPHLGQAGPGDKLHGTNRLRVHPNQQAPARPATLPRAVWDDAETGVGTSSSRKASQVGSARSIFFSRK